MDFARNLGRDGNRSYNTTHLPKKPIFPRQNSVEPILKTENLWKLYRAGKVEVPALRGVNFEVAPGESVAVMGPSGCGKSSLLYVIGGLAQASRGRVLVDGNDLTTMSDAARTKLRRHKIGFVFQRFNLLPTLDRQRQYRHRAIYSR